uniref:Proteasome subunit beta type-7 n=1 Tax=Triatoma infestans TaxID=30076 RepID=A0A161MGY0_TRIIF
MGSGSLAAMSVLESQWHPDMEEEEAKQLVRNAIIAGIFNDLGSGSSCDICVIKKNSIEYIRPYDVANIKGVKQGIYKFRRGATAVLSHRVIPLEIESEEVRRLEQECMDTST